MDDVILHWIYLPDNKPEICFALPPRLKMPQKMAEINLFDMTPSRADLVVAVYENRGFTDHGDNCYQYEFVGVEIR